jgi:hypothetical protein
MKTKNVMLGLALLAAAAAVAVSCKKQGGDKGDSTPDGSADMSADMSTVAATDAMDPPARAPADMRPRPAMDRPAPRGDAAFAKQLAAITADMESKDPKERSKARKALDALLKANPSSAALANLLLQQESGRLAEKGVRIWKRLKKEKPEAFTKAMIGAFGHESDRVRTRAALSFWMRIDEKMARAVEPKVKPLLRDESCLVRRAAYDALNKVYRKTDHKDERKQLAKAALFDEKCPNVQQWGAYQLRWAKVNKATPKLTVRLRKLAKTSPWYLARCSALLALARFKDKETEKIAGSFFGEPASTALVLYYLDSHTPYSQNMSAGTMTECAARAAALYAGKRPQRNDVKDALTYWQALAQKGLAPKPPANACLTRKDCEKGKTYCVANACVPPNRAWTAYWTFKKLEKCYKPDKTAHLRNFTEPPRVQSGFGTHFNAHFGLRKAFRRSNENKYDAEAKKLRAHQCPAK